MKTPNTYSQLVEKALSGLFKNTLAFSAALLLAVGLAFGYFVLRPTLTDLDRVKHDTKEALQKRNQELVRSAVEQAAGNITRILGSAENALSDLQSKVSTFRKEQSASIIPLEKEFEKGGSLEKLLVTRMGYSDPVTFDTPQIKLNYPSEGHLLGAVWKQFYTSAKRIHSQNPELKWIYVGTAGGNFLVFPTSPMIPKDYDPRKRSWFQTAMQENKTVWVTPYFTAGGNDLVLTIATPINRPSIMSGSVAGLDVVMADIINNLLTTPYCEKCMFYLVNEKREIIGKRGNSVVGQNWQQVPASSLLMEDLLTYTSAESSKLLLEKLYADSSFAKKNDGLSRMPNAAIISNQGDTITLMAAPISILGWKLVGVVPTTYVGTDGEAVVGGVEKLIKSGQTQFALLYLGVVAFIIALIYLMFRVAKQSVHRTLSPAIGKLSELSRSLANLKLDTPIGSISGNEDSETDEYKQIVGALNQLRENLDTQIKEREHLKVQAELGNLAAQVAHDIKSPLSALSALEHDLSSVPEATRILTRKALNRIKDIANNLLQHSKEVREMRVDEKGRPIIESLDVKPTNVFLAVDSVVSEMRQKYISRPNVNIDIQCDSRVSTAFAKANTIELQRLVSNLINNAVEACVKDVEVEVRVSKNQNSIVVEVEDNGIGISADLIPSLCQFGSTYGKPNGNGIGLFHAKQHVEAWAGKFEIGSIVGKGTTIRIALPILETPSWFCDTIEVPRADGGKIIILDDDDSIHAVWDKRFSSLDPSRVVHFMKSQDLLAWVSEQKETNSILFLCDFELRDESINGIEVILKSGLKNKAVLVSSRSDEEGTVQEAIKAGIKVLPKQLADLVKIVGLEETRFDVALIDDDALMRQTWSLQATHSNKKIACFASIDEFHKAHISKDTPIYIDLNLGKVSGLDVAARLHSEGYSELKLATGEESLQNIPFFIKSVCGKEFPLH